MKYGMLAVVALSLAAFTYGVGRAQSDTDQHPRGAKVREACQADIQKLCADAEPGRGVFQCVRQHQDQVSDGCKAALASAHGSGQWRGRSGDGASSQQSPAPSGPPSQN